MQNPDPERQQQKPTISSTFEDAPNPGDPGPEQPAERIAVDPSEDPRIPNATDLPPHGG